MRNTAAVVALSVLLGGLVGGLVIYLVVQDALQPGPRPGNSRDQADGTSLNPRPGVAKNPVPRQAIQAGEWGALIASANSLVASGKLQEAQELYLAVLLMEPSHRAAMRGLVRVVRLSSRGDATALRRQAEEYRRAIAQGLETEEHYTGPAMELLARASLQAAAELQRSRRRGERPPPAQSADTARSQSKAPPADAKPRRARPPAKPTTSAAKIPPKPAAPSPIPPVNVNEPFVAVAVGPIASGEQASAITADLTIAGFAARVQRQEAGGYVITLGPYRESEARRAAAYVTSRFGQGLPVVLTPVR